MAVLFQREASNPILTAEDMPYAAEAVLNPGVTEQEGEVVLLLRVEERTGRSNIHIARSKDGVSNWRIEKAPLLQHGLPANRYETWGCEDARITWLESEKCWYVVYTAYSDAGAAVALARTCDLEKVERIGLIFPPNNKDAALFPEKFGERWAALHRPDAGGGVENIWIAYSPDLTHWGDPHLVLTEGQGPAWDAVTVGTGPPPVRTRLGWLLLYHGSTPIASLPGRPETCSSPPRCTRPRASCPTWSSPPAGCTAATNCGSTTVRPTRVSDWHLRISRPSWRPSAPKSPPPDSPLGRHALSPAAVDSS
jgi:predicted GH43/DUF377 family glycosyl hydrolase